MHPDTVNKLNGFGVVFRFVTPFFQFVLGILSAIILLWVSGLRTDMGELKSNFTNHLSDHKSIELILERRLTQLETLIRNKRK